MTNLLIPKILCLLIIIGLFGCAEYKVDTVDEWCEQISGVDLGAKHRPFWAVIFGVSVDGDSIRNEYTEMLNKLHLEKVENRTPKMAWREGTDLHLVNFSSLLVVEPEQIIDEWRRGIELSKQFKHQDSLNKCLYDTLTSLFDNLHIHTMESDVFGKNWTEKITVISTDREKKLGKDRL